MSTIAIETETIDFRGLGAMLDRSIPSLHRDDSAGRLPKGIRIGRSRKWLRSEIMAWLEAGCPPRDEWERAKSRRA